MNKLSVNSSALHWWIARRKGAQIQTYVEIQKFLYTYFFRKINKQRFKHLLYAWLEVFNVLGVMNTFGSMVNSWTPSQIILNECLK